MSARPAVNTIPKVQGLLQAFAGMMEGNPFVVEQDSVDGPASLDETYSWPWYGAQRLADIAWSAGLGNFAGMLTEACGRVVVTTTYSGMGCAEMVCPMISSAWASLGAQVSFKLYSATDVDATCRRVLQCHKEDSQPEHVFGDVLERIPKALRDSLIRKGERLRALLAARACEAERQGMQVDALSAYKAEQTKRLGLKYVAAVKAAFRQRVFSLDQECWCHRHRRMCQTCPVARAESASNRCGPTPGFSPGRQTPGEAKGALHIEIAGTTCVAWSSMGAGQGWLRESSLPCLVWCHWVLHSEPDIVIHECTRSFDQSLLQDILGSKYVVESAVTTPTDFGIPANRHRKYTLCRLKRRIAALVAPSASSRAEGLCGRGKSHAQQSLRGGGNLPAHVSTFQYNRSNLLSAFARNTLLAADIYLCAPDDMVRTWAAGLAQKRHATVSADGSFSEFLLPPGQRVRLEEYQRRHEKTNTDGNAVSIVNLMQSPSRFSSPKLDVCVPALLRGSHLFCLSPHARRPFLAEEHLVMQGIPLANMLPPTSRHSQFFPFNVRVDELMTETQVRRFAGNGMHLSQVGNTLMFALAGVAEAHLCHQRPQTVLAGLGKRKMHEADGISGCALKRQDTGY
jgi:site-specific DNA-cytosine methylase